MGTTASFEKIIEMWYFGHFKVVSFRCEKKAKIFDIILFFLLFISDILHFKVLVLKCFFEPGLF